MGRKVSKRKRKRGTKEYKKRGGNRVYFCGDTASMTVHRVYCFTDCGAQSKDVLHRLRESRQKCHLQA